MKQTKNALAIMKMHAESTSSMMLYYPNGTTLSNGRVKDKSYQVIFLPLLNRIFNGKKALISSTKSMTGHECWMAGASEVVYSLIMMHNNFAAPNINLENRDEYSAPLNLAGTTIDMNINTVLSNSFGFGGTNSALVIKKI